MFYVYIYIYVNSSETNITSMFAAAGYVTCPTLQHCRPRFSRPPAFRRPGNLRAGASDSFQLDESAVWFRKAHLMTPNKNPPNSGLEPEPSALPVKWRVNPHAPSRTHLKSLPSHPTWKCTLAPFQEESRRFFSPKKSAHKPMLAAGRAIGFSRTARFGLRSPRREPNHRGSGAGEMEGSVSHEASARTRTWSKSKSKSKSKPIQRATLIFGEKSDRRNKREKVGEGEACTGHEAKRHVCFIKTLWVFVKPG